ncbi:hypothetical protein KUH03_32475 [Sphingobacterium sp. E70]|nr:hypothetical protein [Sphingobacterium sp. E70]ULT23815.1 hypothetical protein KUH03_32475 [Sphingobacterium sp. E70]
MKKQSDFCLVTTDLLGVKNPDKKILLEDWINKNKMENTKVRWGSLAAVM